MSNNVTEATVETIENALAAAKARKAKTKGARPTPTKAPLIAAVGMPRPTQALSTRAPGRSGSSRSTMAACRGMASMASMASRAL